MIDRATTAASPSYLARIDAASPAQRWPLARGFLLNEPLPFLAELRRDRPVCVLPELTLVSRFADCSTILRRHQDFGADLYKPMQGSYFMTQDDTAQHWREKSIMKAILHFEDLPAIRQFVAQRTSAILAQARGQIDVPQILSRHVPVEVVRKFFGFENAHADDLIAWSYWNQQDAFHNQPFDEVDPQRAALIVRKRKWAAVRIGWRVGRTVLERIVAVKQGSKATDAITRMVRLYESGIPHFPLQRVVLNAGGLLIGAVETTSHAACNALHEILARPAAFAAARDAATRNDPGFDGFVWEALRFRPAFPYFFRVCHAATELAGSTAAATVVQPGTTVLAVTHSAMFDESNFPDPGHFDPARGTADNFTFGLGIHECLGRAVAGAMLPEIVRQVLCLPALKEVAPIDYQSGVPEHYRLRWDMVGTPETACPAV